MHLSNKELNSCYNPLTQFRKKSKTSKTKIITTQVSNSIINSKQKKYIISSVLSLKMKKMKMKIKLKMKKSKTKLIEIKILLI